MSGDPGAGWRVAGRLARREVRRRPGRTALVGALVALPVALMLVGVVGFRAGERTSEEEWRFSYGQADAVLDWEGGFGPVPIGSRTVDVTLLPGVVVGTADGALCRCDLAAFPFERLTEGLVHLLDGRSPDAPDEILLSPQAAEALEVGLGDEVTLNRPVDLRASVVGIGYGGGHTASPLVVVPEGTALPSTDLARVDRLVDLPDDTTNDQLAAWAPTAGPHALSPDFPSTLPSFDTEEGTSTVAVGFTWVAGAVLLTVLGIVIAAAFAASARRQLTTLGQLAANGATPNVLRRVLFLQGTATGIVGSAAGLGLGALVLVALRPRASQIVGHAVDGYDVRPLDVLPIVVIAIVAATVAAMVPAFGVSRVSVLTALAGRRPLGRVSRRHTIAGLLGAATGLAGLGFVAQAGRDGEGSGFVTATAVISPVLLLLGVCAAAPAYVGVLRPVSTRLRGAWRFAGRSLVRQRTRTSAMVAAICAVSAVAVAVAAIGLAGAADVAESRALNDLPDDVVLIHPGGLDPMVAPVSQPADVFDQAVRRVNTALPNAERYDIAEAAEPGQPGRLSFEIRSVVGGDWLLPQRAAIVDDEFRDAFALDATTRRRLDEVGVVYAGEAPGRITVDAIAPGRRVTFDAAVVGPEHALGFGSSADLLITPAKVQDLGLAGRPAYVALRTPEPLTDAQRSVLDEVGLVLQAEHEEAGLAAPRLWLDYYQPGLRAGAGFIETAAAGAALAFALFVVAAGLALAAAETRDERDVLAAVGAAPRAARRISGCKAFLLTGLGGALAVPVGLLPIAVYSRIDSEAVGFLVPWRTIGLLVVVVPLVAAAIAALATRVSLRLRPLAVSTAAFE